MSLYTNFARNFLSKAKLISCTREFPTRASQISQACLLRTLSPVTCQCLFSTTPSSLSRQHRTIKSQNFSTSPAIQYVENEENSDTLQKVADRMAAPDVGRLFAVIHFSGNQRKVTEEDIVAMRLHTEADIGELIRFNKVLLVGGADFTVLGRPVLSPEMVRVEGRVIEKTLTQTKIIYRYRARQNNSRMKLHKGPQTLVRITKIEIVPLQQ